MLPSNHATHDSTMESYTTSISWRSLEARRNKTGVAMHFLSSFAAALGTWARVPGARPAERNGLPCSYSFLLPRLPRLSCQTLPVCLPACSKKEVLEHILFLCVYSAGIRGVQSRRPLSIAASRFLLQFWTGTTATAWHFGTVIGNQNLLRLSALCPAPLCCPCQ